MREKIELPAVRDKELSEILEYYGILDELNSGNLSCSSCEEDLNWENLGGFIIKENKPVLFCSSVDCIEEIQLGEQND